MRRPLQTAASQVIELLRDGVRQGVYGQGEILVAQRGRVILHERACADPRARFFDLASLTKPLCTAALCALAVAEGRLSLDQSVGEILAGGGFDGVSVCHLLNHTSGFKAWFDFASRGLRRREILAALLADRKFRARPGKTVYSDLGFIVLGALLEKIYRRPLDEIFQRRITRPLRLARALFFVPRGHPPYPKDRFVPSVVCRWRGREICGEVMDENAFAMGGVAGHAGLFGDAAAVHALLAELRRAALGRSRLFTRATWQTFCRPDTRRPWSRRVFTLGFDTPTHPGSQSGHHFSKSSIGHLGFSGTSFWWDLEKDVWVILLTNRCMPLRQNNKLSAFRPRLHDAVMRWLMAT